MEVDTLISPVSVFLFPSLGLSQKALGGGAFLLTVGAYLLTVELFCYSPCRCLEAFSHSKQEPQKLPRLRHDY